MGPRCLVEIHRRLGLTFCLLLQISTTMHGFTFPNTLLFWYNIPNICDPIIWKSHTLMPSSSSLSLGIRLFFCHLALSLTCLQHCHCSCCVTSFHSSKTMSFHCFRYWMSETVFHQNVSANFSSGARTPFPPPPLHKSANVLMPSEPVAYYNWCNSVVLFVFENFP